MEARSIAPKDTDLCLYYNLPISNPATATAPIVANFSQSLDQAILAKCQYYHLVILRMLIPLQSVPFFRYPSTPYTLTLGYNSNWYQANVNFAAIDSSTSNILAVQQFLNMVNSAFSTAFAALQAANPSAAQFINAPQITYSASTQLFSLVVDRYAWTANDPGSPSIWFCSQLMEKFSNMMNVAVSWNSASGRDCKLVIQELANNISTNPTPGAFVSTLTTALTQNAATSSLAVGALVNTIISGVQITVSSSKTNGSQAISQTFTTAGSASPAATSILVKSATAIYPFEIGSVVSMYQPQQITMTEVCPSVVDWLSIRRVMLTSTSMPCRPEYFPSQALPGNTSGIASQTQPIPMITDFLIVPPTTLNSFNTLVFNTVVYREIDLMGDSPLNRLDLKFQYVDSDNSVTDLLINPGETVDIKLLLKPKRYAPLEAVVFKNEEEASDRERAGGRLIKKARYS